MPTDGVHSPISNKQKHGVARMEDTERPTRLGSGAWGRRQGLAGLRDDAPSEARGADGERAGRRPQAPTRRQAREHKLRGRQAGSSRSGRQAGGPSGRLAAQTPSRQLAARTPSGRAEWAGRVGGPSGRAEWAGRAGGPSGRAERAGRAGGPSGRAEWAGRAGGPSGRAERAGRAGGPSGRAERAGRAGGPPPPGTNTQNTRIQRGRDPPRQTAQRTPAS